SAVDSARSVTTRRNPASTDEDGDGSGWDQYVQANLDSLGWTNSTLAVRAEIDRSLIGRWLNEGTVPSVESVRAVAKAFRRPVWDGLVAAKIVNEDELIGGTPKSGEPDLRLVDDETLLAEVRRRMARGRPPRDGAESVHTEIAEQSGMDVGEVEEHRPETRSTTRGRRGRRSSSRVAS